MTSKWDLRFLALAEHVAQWSKDPSTQVGCVIVRPDGTICSTGYNGFPRQMDDAPELYEDRALKYLRTIHAEMNAILSAPEPVRGYTIYTTLMPCPNCALMVIQAGITRVVSREPTADLTARWRFERTKDFFLEAGVYFEVVA